MSPPNNIDDMNPDALFASALQLALADESRDSHDYWLFVRALHARPERDVFAIAVGSCESDSAIERVVAADVLAQLGTADPNGIRPFTGETLPVLRRLLADNNDQVVASAIHALSHHRSGDANDLRQIASCTSREVREAVAFALSGREEPEAIALLLKLMTDVDDGVRNWATFAVGTQCDADTPDIRTALAANLTDADAEIRGEAMVGLARRRTSPTAP